MGTAAGKRCPPGDVGGEPGDKLFLEAIADRRYRRHQEMPDWTGPPPVRAARTFDLNAINQRLAGIKA